MAASFRGGGGMPRSWSRRSQTRASVGASETSVLSQDGPWAVTTTAPTLASGGLRASISGQVRLPALSSNRASPGPRAITAVRMSKTRQGRHPASTFSRWTRHPLATRAVLIRSRRVVLPAPCGPTMAPRQPCPASRSTRSSKSPDGSRKDKRRTRSDRNGLASAGTRRSVGPAAGCGTTDSGAIGRAAIGRGATARAMPSASKRRTSQRTDSVRPENALGRSGSARKKPQPSGERSTGCKVAEASSGSPLPRATQDRSIHPRPPGPRAIPETAPGSGSVAVTSP